MKHWMVLTMKKILNECCDCAVPGYPCSPTCLLKAVIHYYCDKCKEETKLYEYEGKELCIDCIEEMLDVVKGSDI